MPGVVGLLVWINLISRVVLLTAAWTVLHLESLDHEHFARSALPPRLNVPMRLVDSMLFVAEHDDHHLAAITELARNRGQ